MDPMLDFTGKVALITGAASGFGKLLAAELGKRGARLVLGDINMDALDKLAADLEGQGVTAQVMTREGSAQLPAPRILFASRVISSSSALSTSCRAIASRPIFMSTRAVIPCR